jgi:hypothetical protein
MVPLVDAHVEPDIEPPPVSSCDTDQSDALRAQHDGVMTRWLSSMRPLYRRSVRGRTGLIAVALVTPPPRHRAA